MSKYTAPLYSLTGIRGLAAFWVVAFHVGQGTPGYSLVPRLYEYSLVKNGFRGVDLFFILSGFIMMHAHCADFPTISVRTIKRFAAARLIRIYPVNFVVLLLILGIVLILPSYVAWVRSWMATFGADAYTPISFIQTATLSLRWFMRDFGIWNSVTWSLSVELVAYTTLPMLVVLLNRTRSPLTCLLIATASLAGALGMLVAFGSLDAGSPNRLGLLRGAGGFVAGAAMHRYVSVATVSGTRSKFVAIASVAAIVGLASTDFTLLMPFPFATLIASLSYGKGMIDALLKHPVSIFLGKISFSLYLVHVTPLLMMDWLFASGQISPTTFHVALGIALYCVSIILVSFAVYTWVERPCQRLSRKFFGSIAAPARKMARLAPA